MKVRIPKTPKTQETQETSTLSKIKKEYTLEEIVTIAVNDVINKNLKNGTSERRRIDILPWLLCEKNIKSIAAQLKKRKNKKARESKVAENKRIAKVRTVILNMLSNEICTLVEQYIEEQKNETNQTELQILQELKKGKVFLKIRCPKNVTENRDEMEKIENIIKETLETILTEKLKKEEELAKREELSILSEDETIKIEELNEIQEEPIKKEELSEIEEQPIKKEESIKREAKPMEKTKDDEFFEEVKAHTNKFDYLASDSIIYSSEKGIRDLPQFSSIDNYLRFTRLQAKLQQSLTHSNDELKAIEGLFMYGGLSEVEEEILRERKKALMKTQDNSVKLSAIEKLLSEGNLSEAEKALLKKYKDKLVEEQKSKYNIDKRENR